MEKQPSAIMTRSAKNDSLSASVPVVTPSFLDARTPVTLLLKFDSMREVTVASMISTPFAFLAASRRFMINLPW